MLKLKTSKIYMLTNFFKKMYQLFLYDYSNFFKLIKTTPATYNINTLGFFSSITVYSLFKSCIPKTQKIFFSNTVNKLSPLVILSSWDVWGENIIRYGASEKKPTNFLLEIKVSEASLKNILIQSYYEIVSNPYNILALVFIWIFIAFPLTDFMIWYFKSMQGYFMLMNIFSIIIITAYTKFFYLYLMSITLLVFSLFCVIVIMLLLFFILKIWQFFFNVVLFKKVRLYTFANFCLLIISIKMTFFYRLQSIYQLNTQGYFRYPICDLETGRDFQSYSFYDVLMSFNQSDLLLFGSLLCFLLVIFSLGTHSLK